MGLAGSGVSCPCHDSNLPLRYASCAELRSATAMTEPVALAMELARMLRRERNGHTLYEARGPIPLDNLFFIVG